MGKLPQLPPLPGKGRKATGATSALTPLPPLSASREVSAQTDEGWGGTGVGRWFETTHEQVAVGGTCVRCGREIAAQDLRWTLGPFNRWEGWACRDCRKDAIGLEAANSKPTEKVRRTVEKSRGVKDVRLWEMQQGKDPLDWAGPTEYSEERWHQLIDLSRATMWEDERETYESSWENEGGQ